MSAAQGDGLGKRPQLGAIFPQTEIGSDPGAVRDFAQAAEALGFAYLAAFDHVIGANPLRTGGWSGPYSSADSFHEPLTLFAFLAGVTRTLELATHVLILPQRQTVLVAKQAAEVDLLSGGRLRLGVGIGWNAVEYGALGVEFRRRGRREEEQVSLLRRLWTEETIEFHGRWDAVDNAGLNPRPLRAIPIWFGGSATAVVQRAARLGDGWIPATQPNGEALLARDALLAYLRDYGRDPAEFGIDGAVAYRGDPDRWQRHFEAWCQFGATHVSLNTMRGGLGSVDEHIEALRRYREAVA